MSKSAFRFSSINLGCSKNLVDLEFAIGEILKFSNRMPIEYFDDPEDKDAEYILVNTCGFLSSSREESEATLKKYDDMGKKVIFMGCYVSVKDDKFLASLKHLHGVLSFVDYGNIEKILFGEKPILGKEGITRLKDAFAWVREGKLQEYLDKIGGSQLKTKAFIWDGDEVRAYMHAPFGYEYLKIAEWCDNNCTFCIIPKIRGRQKSRTIEQILKEVEQMVESGISEIEIISQDTTRYGTDLHPQGESMLFELLEALEASPLDFKYRLFYLYPDTLTFSHLEKLTKFEKFIPYFDIPFQHISESILKRMGRFYDGSHIRKLLDFIRTNFPGGMIRTSFIVGFPGEWEAEFNELLEFVEKYKFESVGVFQYHDEALAASSKLSDKVEDSVAKKRVEILGDKLGKIYDAYNEASKGQEFWGYIMDFGEGDTAIVRREIRAPEIDEYEEIPFENLLEWPEELDIGAYVRYVV